MNTTLKDAINRSISHDEIVHCEWDGGDESALVAELSEVSEDVDSVRTEDGIDVWGTDSAGEMEWRLLVTLTKE